MYLRRPILVLYATREELSHYAIDYLMNMSIDLFILRVEQYSQHMRYANTVFLLPVSKTLILV